MLISLHIENVAVVKNVDIDLSSGFTVLTGETGAGKSIVIDSIGLILGAKADRELIRHGEDGLMVSGLFGGLTPGILAEIEDAGVYPDEDGNIFIQRSVSADGRSSVRINGRSVNMLLLKSIAPLLISIHGQNDTRALADVKNHIYLLDIYAKNAALTAEYADEYDELQRIERDIRELARKDSEKLRTLEMLRYQIGDIEDVKPKAGEEDALIEKKLRIKNSERIVKNATFVYKALKGSEKGSVCYLTEKCIAALNQLSDVFPDCRDHIQTLYDVLYKAEDIAESVYAYAEDTEEDTEEALNKIEERLEKISKLKRKYGPEIPDVLAFLARIKAEAADLENSGVKTDELMRRRSELRNSLLAKAEKIHDARVKAASEADGKIRDFLAFLDMPKTEFRTEIRVNYSEGEPVLNRLGYDDVEFYVKINSGGELQPLSKVASGGELARIMLALKSVISDRDGTPTVIFDEIDSGVSGKTARKIGIKLLELSREIQILCVTHSAQIASLADTHLLIKKQDVDGAVQTSVKPLGYEERIGELSRILGGINITESQKNAAKDMLSEKEQYTRNGE